MDFICSSRKTSKAFLLFPEPYADLPFTLTSPISSWSGKISIINRTAKFQGELDWFHSKRIFSYDKLQLCKLLDDLWLVWVSIILKSIWMFSLLLISVSKSASIIVELQWSFDLLKTWLDGIWNDGGKTDRFYRTVDKGLFNTGCMLFSVKIFKNWLPLFTSFVNLSKWLHKILQYDKT